ncbi:DsbA family protein [Comamonas sp. J-3]|uniref:DsbA family oxidoreductase n=1 Tax=Comamonas trifloxystrobinivorans TaxID=3350256 RepID=UPI003728762A
MSLSPPHAVAELHVDFALDLICPWCWIGLRNLLAAREALQAQSPQLSTAIAWHASPLLPHIPEEGVPYQAFYEARLGGAAAVEARRAQVRAAAQAAGLSLNHAAIQVFPNTRLVCALVNHAQTQLGTEAIIGFVESVFSAYFQQGRNIGSVTELQALAQAAGLSDDPAQWETTPQRSSLQPAGGVPHMVFNQRVPVTGAVPVADLLRAMTIATGA